MKKFWIVGALCLVALSGAAQTVSEGAGADDMVFDIAGVIEEVRAGVEKDSESFPELIGRVGRLAEMSGDPVVGAMLHSIRAEMLMAYLMRNRSVIERRTDIVGFVPEDIREWTAGIFDSAVRDEILASLAPDSLLKNTSTTVFDGALVAGDDSRLLSPTLFDFLSRRALAIRPDTAIYRDLLAFRRSQPGVRAAILVELDYLRYVGGESFVKKMERLEALDSLLAIHLGNECSVDIALDKVILLRSLENGYGLDRDSIRGAEYSICKDIIARFPDDKRIVAIRGHLSELERASLSVESGRTVYPGKSLDLRVSFSNVGRVKVRVYESMLNAVEALSGDGGGNDKGRLLSEADFDLSPTHTYILYDTVLRIPMGRTGLYEYTLTSPGDSLEVRGIFSVSRLAVVTRATPSGGVEALVTDFLSGKPVSGATVNCYSSARSRSLPLGAVKTDADGLATLPGGGKISICQAVMDGDTMSPAVSVYSGWSSEAKEAVTEVSLFTDRGIYRPGQTALFKGIAFINDGNGSRAVAGRRFEVVLRDVNQREVSTREVISNEFGSFSGELVIPAKTLAGRFTLSAGGGRTDIRVEEYRRPSFSVALGEIKDEVSFGDQVTVRGNVATFSGALLDEGAVTCRVVRRPFFMPSSRGLMTEELITEVKTSLDASGNFSFTFLPLKDENERFFPGSASLAYQHYEVTASVTDSRGETQTATVSFPVGERSIILSSNLSGIVDKDSARLTIRAATLGGEEVIVKGSYTLTLMEEDVLAGSFRESRVLFKGEYMGGEALDGSVLKSLPSGRIRLNMFALDSKGRPVTGVEDLTLYSRKDKRPPVFSHIWLPPVKSSYDVGDMAEVCFGSSDRDVYLLYELFVGGVNVIRKQVRISNENRVFRIPFTESLGSGAVASFTFVKEGKLHTRQTTLIRRQPDRKLRLKPESLRDKMLPGSRESVRFRVTDADASPVRAEVMAGMYDAALDKITPFEWYFSPVRRELPHYAGFTEGRGMGLAYDYDSRYKGMGRVNGGELIFDRLDWKGALDFPSLNHVLTRGRSMSMMSAAPQGMESESIMMKGGDMGLPPVSSMQPDMGDMQPAPTPLQLRANFSETAFFYPSLLTDKEGNIVINFTLPESNTTWKLQTLAHTPGMRHGMTSAEIITQKPFMVIPSLPRFIREGDKVRLSARIVNLSEEGVAGDVRLEIFDPGSEEVIIPVQRQSFTLSQEGSVTLGWTLSVPSGITGLVGCRIIAESDNGSDGEQHLLPLLPDKISLTESTPIHLTGDTEKKVYMPSAGHPYRMTVEMSSNPVWYAVMALPSVAEPRSDNAISWFTAYYTRALSASIAVSNPRIRKVIEEWRADASSPTLLSNLEQNEDLKTILLEETPWTVEAKTETGQRQQLYTLLDPNRASYQREAAMRELLERQHDDGGWGWFKGFRSDMSITLYILEGMAQLERLGAAQYDTKEKDMQRRAIGYIDRVMGEDYERLRRSGALLDSYMPGPVQLRYIYVRSAYGDMPRTGAVREAITFYARQAARHWTKASLYEKGEIALFLHRNGNGKVALDILAWLRKTSTVSDENGMYWANNRSEHDFIHQPVIVHSLLMDVFGTLDRDSVETDRMRQWLLMQKETQSWGAEPSTVNAVYSLLSGGSDWLSEANRMEVVWGGRALSASRSEAATGYIKETVTQGDITPAMDTLTLRKEGKSPAWGAVYRQYFKSVREISRDGGAISVDKKLFIERGDSSQRRITPLERGHALHTGDKVIVRLTVRADRDMEYVGLKDMRPGCFEPADQRSAISYVDRLVCYHSAGDASENFFFDRLPRGTYVLEYPAYVSRSGTYGGGIATLQCLYAPQFVSHTDGDVIFVEE
ncbi:MAG: alpha-2-macroglobulin [Tannerellaceae bacterium]|nr:alpha-2-macroglobulin [Tannerellaceae bacterium]